MKLKPYIRDFKCNSAVWKALRAINPAKKKNPWIDEIHKFPVEAPVFEGEKIFSKLQTLQMVTSKGIIGILGLRYLPSMHNKEIWRLEKEIDLAILGLVERRSEDTCDKDLLQLILSSAKSYGDNGNLPADITPNKFIVDNCKNIYFIGHETTAIHGV
ncbi:Cytochrome [Abeliophyllum distichum]|uniref:Cytochrome n=1 Tax=Abeliophyllum distichum TaxID=126358 RepID=A0ABD1V3S4_9LAMI